MDFCFLFTRWLSIERDILNGFTRSHHQEGYIISIEDRNKQKKTEKSFRNSYDVVDFVVQQQQRDLVSTLDFSFDHI